MGMLITDHMLSKINKGSWLILAFMVAVIPKATIVNKKQITVTYNTKNFRSTYYGDQIYLWTLLLWILHADQVSLLKSLLMWRRKQLFSRCIVIAKCVRLGYFWGLKSFCQMWQLRKGLFDTIVYSLCWRLNLLVSGTKTTQFIYETNLHV